jgi:hypothetical protein
LCARWLAKVYTANARVCFASEAIHFALAAVPLYIHIFRSLSHSGKNLIKISTGRPTGAKMEKWLISSLGDAAEVRLRDKSPQISRL